MIVCDVFYQENYLGNDDCDISKPYIDNSQTSKNVQDIDNKTTQNELNHIIINTKEKRELDHAKDSLYKPRIQRNKSTYNDRLEYRDSKQITTSSDQESSANTLQESSNTHTHIKLKQNETYKLEKEYKEKDPVKKDQYDDYNKSLCMSNMYPENSVIIAPGEGKIPQNVLYDNDWDIKAFPHINSPDGKYGLHFGRQTKLSDQH